MNTPHAALDRQTIERYLAARHAAPVVIEALQPLGPRDDQTDALKQFGYGGPLLITYRVGGQTRREVLHALRRNMFGRERSDDRVAAVWLDYETFNQLPNHVPAVDMVLLRDGRLESLAGAQSLHLVTTYRPGQLYADDLLALRDGRAVTPRDVQRVERLADYLAAIHRVTHSDDWLWRRRLRDLIGHGEGIMGLTDSYPADGPATAAELRAIEEAANDWRWRLKGRGDRLAQVHGDFHPFNLLFDADDQLNVLDRSRGAWGEPADDVSCLTINYLFFSLQAHGRLDGDFATLHSTFWQRYLAQRPDDALCDVIQPWLAWRALVLASPRWYPTIAPEVRRQILTLAQRVLASERYAWQHVNQYF